MSLSDEPGGATNDGLPLDRERVRLTIADKPVDIFLVRVPDPQAGEIWLISSASLAQVPLLRASLEKTWVEEQMPEPLVSHGVMPQRLGAVPRRLRAVPRRLGAVPRCLREVPGCV